MKKSSSDNVVVLSASFVDYSGQLIDERRLKYLVGRQNCVIMSMWAGKIMDPNFEFSSNKGITIWAGKDSPRVIVFIFCIISDNLHHDVCH